MESSHYQYRSLTPEAPLSPASTSSMQSEDLSEYANDMRVMEILAGLQLKGTPLSSAYPMAYPSVNSTPRQPNHPPILQPSSSKGGQGKGGQGCSSQGRLVTRRALVIPPLSSNPTKPTHRENMLMDRVKQLEHLLQESQDRERVSRARQEGTLNSARETHKQREAGRIEIERTKAMMSSMGAEKSGLVARISNLQSFLAAEKKVRLEAEAQLTSQRSENELLASQLEASQRMITELRSLLVEAGSLNGDKVKSVQELNERCLRLSDRVAKYKEELAAVRHELEATRIDNERLDHQVKGLHLIITEMNSQHVMQAAEKLMVESEESRKPTIPRGGFSITARPPIPVCGIKGKEKPKEDEGDDIDELFDQMEGLMAFRARRAPQRNALQKKTDVIVDESECEEEGLLKVEKDPLIAAAAAEVPHIRPNPPIRFLSSCPLQSSPKKSKSPLKGKLREKTRSKPPIQIGPPPNEAYDQFLVHEDKREEDDDPEIHFEAGRMVETFTSRRPRPLMKNHFSTFVEETDEASGSEDDNQTNACHLVQHQVVMVPSSSSDAFRQRLMMDMMSDEEM